MSPFAWTLFHLRGIPVRGHLSLLVVLPLLAFSIARDTLPFVLVHMDATRADLAMPIELLGLLLAFALFAAITAHELGHAAVTLRQGGRVRQITLMVFGGVAEIDHEDATPGQQITMALAGPAVSLALATISAGLSLIVWLPVDALAALRVFALMNIVLGVFNLLPAYPLDGGRVLRGALAFRLAPLDATRAAVVVGRAFALVGVALSVAHRDPMLMILAGYLFFAGGADEAAGRLRHALKGLRARQALTTRVATVDPTATLSAVARHMLHVGATAAVVRDVQGARGVLTLAEVRRGGPRTAAEALRGEPLWARPDDELSLIARALQDGVQTGVLVVDDMNFILGVVTWEELSRAGSLRSAADVRPARAGQHAAEARTASQSS